MATVLQHQLLGCEGFGVESASGLLGSVEETWLGPTGEPTALAIRTPEGHRGLLVADDVEAVAREKGLVLVRPGGRVLDLDVPRSRAQKGERPLWEVVAILYASLALVVGLVMAVAFLAAYLAGGAAY